MTLTPQEREALAMEYVAGVVDAAGRARIEFLIADDPVLNSRVAHWQEQFSAIDDTADEMRPSFVLWRRIETSLTTAALMPRKYVQPSKVRRGGLMQSVSFWRWSALAASLAMVALVTALVLRWPSQPIMIAVLSAEGGQPGAIVQTFANGDVQLIPLSVVAVPEGRALEVWTLRDKAEGPISVGLLSEARTVKLNLGKLPLPREGQLFEITVEPPTGSPTGRPTGPILFKGLTADAL